VCIKNKNHKTDTDMRRHRGAYPCLIHAEEGKTDANEQSSNPSHAPRHALLILPGTKVVAAKSGAEPKVLDKENNAESKSPVSQHSKKVFDDCLELVATTPSQGKDNGRKDATPKETRHGNEMLTPQLDR